MDGNGRWARAILPRVAGAQKVSIPLKITKRANQLGVKMLTVYAFSQLRTGNDPEQKSSFLMKLPKVLCQVCATSYWNLECAGRDH